MTGAMGSSQAFEHFRNAGIEVLKGFRAVLDAQIEALGRRQSERGTKIPVE
jgi:predicted Fe-Mo cluster-binding NifX family protein